MPPVTGEEEWEGGSEGDTKGFRGRLVPEAQKKNSTLHGAV